MKSDRSNAKALPEENSGKEIDVNDNQGNFV